MSPSRPNWIPRDRWEALVSGEGCPACAEVTEAGQDNSDGYFVTDLRVSRLRLQRNQHLPGWCVLLLHRHVREPHELPEAERIAFFEDMVRVGRALEQVYAAIKINYSILGNIVPHVHAHTAARTMREDRSMPLFNFDHRHIPARHTISTRLRLSPLYP